MRKILVLLILVLLFLPYIVNAKDYTAIIYSDKRSSVTGETINDLASGFIVNSRVLSETENKVVTFVRIRANPDETGQFTAIKNEMRQHNGCTGSYLMGPPARDCSTTVGQQILAWWNWNQDNLPSKMWEDVDVHNVYTQIIKDSLYYYVDPIPCEDPPCKPIRVKVSVAEGEPYNEVIDPSKLQLPLRWLE